MRYTVHSCQFINKDGDYATTSWHRQTTCLRRGGIGDFLQRPGASLAKLDGDRGRAVATGRSVGHRGASAGQGADPGTGPDLHHR
ncbi:hypothetical protein MASSI9I_50190 [Massilia sp. 9I]|nr:hypothetical protein MASSI9I_50190 [Massilia sp. 9I]